MRQSTTNIYLLCAINLLLASLGIQCPLVTTEGERKNKAYKTSQSGNLAVRTEPFVGGKSRPECNCIY